MIRYAKFVEAFGSVLVLGAALWWALATSPYESRLAALDRELLYQVVNAVQDDVLRSSTWFMGDREGLKRDLDVIYGRIDAIKEEKEELKALHSEISNQDIWRVIVFLIGSALVILAKILEGMRDLTR